jgi:hypothetical protein
MRRESGIYNRARIPRPSCRLSAQHMHMHSLMLMLHWNRPLRAPLPSDAPLPVPAQ